MSLVRPPDQPGEFCFGCDVAVVAALDVGRIGAKMIGYPVIACK